MKDSNKHLMESIAARDVQAVRDCLENGSDPNYFDETFGHGEEALHQPNTPLKLVIFCVSDNILSDKDLGDFKEIAQLLLSYNADPVPAIELARIRYGDYDPNIESTPFMEVWQLVVEAGDKTI